MFLKLRELVIELKYSRQQVNIDDSADCLSERLVHARRSSWLTLEKRRWSPRRLSSSA